MPIRTIIVGDQEAINKINKLAKKYNLSALIKLEILNQFSDKNINVNVDIKRMRGRPGGMLRGKRMNIYLDKKTNKLLDQIKRKDKKFNFSEFCRQIFVQLVD
jgi:hypothetical protein